MSQNICYYCLSTTDGKDRCPVCGTRANYNNQPPALRAGTVLAGQYLVGRSLGRGGFGITYLGLDNLQRKVVIKEFFPKKIAKRLPGETAIKPESDEHAENYEMGIKTFLNEAITLAKFDDPNIGKIYYSFRENNAAYFVAPYKEGATLEELERRQPGGMREDTLLEIMEEIFNGLEKVHQAGIVHRDIKPSNIYIPNGEPPFLIDFGNARAFSARSRLTVFLTHGYAPLEQYSENLREGKQGPRTDIYACAATMYACLQGKRSDNGNLIPPAPAPDRVAGAKVTDIQKISRRSISSQTARAIMKGLELNPQKRPQSVAEFRSLLQKVPRLLDDSKNFELLCLAGEFEGERFPLTEQPIIIGRSRKHCNLVLSDIPMNRGVSRKHCQVWAIDNKVMVRDLASTHGTRINDTMTVSAGQSTDLQQGDCFSLAGNIVFQLLDAEDAQVTPQKHLPEPPDRHSHIPEKGTMSTDITRDGFVRRFFKKVLFH